MTQNEQKLITVGNRTASILFDNGLYGLCFGRLEGGEFIAHRSAGSYRTLAGAEKAARKSL
jgi:hypothetical protein